MTRPGERIFLRHRSDSIVATLVGPLPAAWSCLELQPVSRSARQGRSTCAWQGLSTVEGNGQLSRVLYTEQVIALRNQYGVVILSSSVTSGAVKAGGAAAPQRVGKGQRTAIREPSSSPLGKGDLPNFSQYGDSSHPTRRMGAVRGAFELALHL